MKVCHSKSSACRAGRFRGCVGAEHCQGTLVVLSLFSEIRDVKGFTTVSDEKVLGI